MKLLTKEQQKSYENSKPCHISKEKFENKYLKDKKYHNVKDYCHFTRKYRGGAHSLCNSKYSVPKKVFHNESNYNCHFVIKELAEELSKRIYLFRRKHCILHIQI